MRTASTATDFPYLAVLGPFAEDVVGVDMVLDVTAVNSAVEKAVKNFADLCMSTSACK